MNLLIYLTPLVSMLLKRELSGASNAGPSSSSQGNGVLTVTRGPQVTNYNHISTIDPVAVVSTAASTPLVVTPVPAPPTPTATTFAAALLAAHIESSIGGDSGGGGSDSTYASSARKSSQLPGLRSAWRALWKRGEADTGGTPTPTSTATSEQSQSRVGVAIQTPSYEVVALPWLVAVNWSAVDEGGRVTFDPALVPLLAPRPMVEKWLARQTGAGAAGQDCVRVVRGLEGGECEGLAARYGMTWEQFRDRKQWLVECASIVIIERHCGAVVNGTAAGAATMTLPASGTLGLSFTSSSTALPTSSLLDGEEPVEVLPPVASGPFSPRPKPSAMANSTSSSIVAAGAAYMPARALVARADSPVASASTTTSLSSSTSAPTATYTASTLTNLQKEYRPQGDPFDTYPNSATAKLTLRSPLLTAVVLAWTVLFILSFPLRTAAAAITSTDSPTSTSTLTNQQKEYRPQGDPFDTYANSAPAKPTLRSPLLPAIMLIWTALLALSLPLRAAVTARPMTTAIEAAPSTDSPSAIAATPTDNSISHRKKPQPSSNTVIVHHHHGAASTSLPGTTLLLLGVAACLAPLLALSA